VSEPQPEVNTINDVVSVSIQFDDNSVLPLLFGEHDCHLTQIEKKLSIETSSRGNVLALSGDAQSVEVGKQVIENLYQRLQKGYDISVGEIDAEIRMSDKKNGNGNKSSRHDLFFDKEMAKKVSIPTFKKTVMPYSHVQADYIQALYNNDMVFALGPAGTGKTYLAVAMAVSLFMSRKIDRIILSRPAVEAGEKLGFLPGDLKEKIDPYLRPLYDALFDMIPAEKVHQYIENGEIEVAPLAFMRGRTLSNACIILDEAQNTTPTQMKMFLTRLGEGSRMIITGDLSQVDLPRDIKSGLSDAIKKVQHIDGIHAIRFSDEDVVRHDLAAKIVQAYEESDKQREQVMQQHSA
jgi:phosphate starvation-inducible PhoH-like protein